jgi:ketosteroid isomerase-like protein
MSQANVAIIRRAKDLWASTGNWEAVLQLYHSDAEFRDLQHAPDVPEVVRGLDAIRDVMAQWTEVYDDFRPEVYEYVDADRWVVCDVRWYGKGKGSDLVVDFHGADAYEIEDGEIVRVIVGYPDVATAVEAVRRMD